jgi:NTE family protein
MRSLTNRHFLQILTLLLFVLITSPNRAGTAIAQGKNDERPRIGLALSGGGARGAAHHGVLRILERENIPINYIAGTSMGSIAGGKYASGLSVKEIEEQFIADDWGDVFDDKIERKDRSFRSKDGAWAVLFRLRVC